MKVSIPRLIVPSVMTTAPTGTCNALLSASAATMVNADSSTAPFKLLLEEVLSPRYYRRLKLDPTLLDAKPTIRKLQQLTEAHVGTIPFENIAQHGAAGGLQTLDLRTIVDKVLHRNRGGYCFELNGLFSYWLRNELHYPMVRRIEAALFRQDGRGFNCPSTHMILMVQTSNDNDDAPGDESNSNFNNLYFVDVAFGEPPIHPLKYVMDLVQVTPEGMVSKLSRDENDDDYVVLYWYKDNEWVPRLRWNYTDSMVLESSSDDLVGSLFEQVLLPRTHEPESLFTQKLIVCTISRTQKMTLAGNKLKITGPPRFPTGTPSASTTAENGVTAGIVGQSKDEDKNKNHGLVEKQQPELNGGVATTTTIVPVVTTELTNEDDIRKTMLNVFGIPYNETCAMDFTTSIQANPEVWSAL